MLAEWELKQIRKQGIICYNVKGKQPDMVTVREIENLNYLWKPDKFYSDFHFIDLNPYPEGA